MRVESGGRCAGVFWGEGGGELVGKAFLVGKRGYELGAFLNN